MQPSVESLVRLLESYRGRDKVIRTVCYGSQLVGGVLSQKEEDAGVRLVSLLTNVADQLYYPCEHIAWAADAELIKGKSDKWWLLSTVLWGTSLLLGILRSLRVLLLLKKKLKRYERGGGGNSRSQLRRQMQREVLSILSSMADLCNAIHWMPPGFLWAGRFPNWLVGLMGTISSLIGLIQVNAGDSDETDSP
ncbi:peroxisomal membrane protein 11C isoform X2 [Cyclopterus lumpus]|uniref:peroxisomal membrane protein 11C isoform X2 n=1 Tax=Cyclopterus lumpus TaxID=8103 RepID=UPI0014860355|nr:peroxisomal membrane protein 11C isoform X2 [Cyclopterus lumpus]